MAIDFPASPVDSQLFTSSNGYVYTYKTATGGWLLTGTGGSVGPPGPTGPQGAQGIPGAVTVSVSDTAPGSPTASQLWWNSANGNLYIYYNDGTSSQWVQVNSTGAL